MSVRILLIDQGDAALWQGLQSLLAAEDGYHLERAATARQVLGALRLDPSIAAIIVNLNGHRGDGLALVRRARALRPALPVIVTAPEDEPLSLDDATIETCARLEQPIDPTAFRACMEMVLEQGAAEREAHDARRRFQEPVHDDGIVGESRAMARLRASLEQVARVDTTLLLVGETGTGKELVARLVHRAGHRRDRPFVVVACATPGGPQLERDLFGSDRGAFPGATTSRMGLLEAADGGTLLLDEVGELPADVQVRLVGFLQDRRVRRLGATRERRVDVRVIATTQRPLAQAVRAGTFRTELFHRLGGVVIDVPPLRAHLEDLPALCRHLGRRLARRHGRPPVTVTEQALASLASRPFPGNVRELENLLERALVLGGPATGPRLVIDADDLLPPLEAGGEDGLRRPVPLENGFRVLASLHDELERDLIERALAAWPTASHGEIAERLGTNRRVLELRLQRFGLSKATARARKAADRLRA